MISAVIPISPVPSHPEIAILEETVASVRHHLPDAEIHLCFDGVRTEQKHRRADYEEAIRRTLWRADHDWGNCCPWIWDEHAHQVGMLRGVIDEMRTKLLLYVEQDSPLVTDEPIDWRAITDFIESGESNCVRLHHEGRVPVEHEPMMHGAQDGFIRTSQYSARPHVATVAFYRRALECFSPNANSFLEDRLHGVIDEAYKLDGISGWHQWRLHIYAQDGENLKRSYHLDGRAGDPKFDDLQRF